VKALLFREQIHYFQKPAAGFMATHARILDIDKWLTSILTDVGAQEQNS